MDNNLKYLGIYENSINNAIRIAEKAVEPYGEHTDDVLYTLAMEHMKTYGSFEYITESIIEGYFEAAKTIIEDIEGEETVDYLIGENSSHLYVKCKEII